MPNNTIDNLNIRVASDATAATESLLNLATTLETLKSSISGYETEFGKVGTSLKGLKNAIKDFNKEKFQSASVKELTSSLRKLTNIDLSNIQNADFSALRRNLEFFSKMEIDSSSISSINRIKNALKNLAEIDYKAINTAPIKHLINMLKGLSDVSMSDSISNVIQSVSGLMSACKGFTEYSAAINSAFSTLRDGLISIRDIGPVDGSIARLIQAINDLLLISANIPNAMRNVKGSMASIGDSSSRMDLSGEERASLESTDGVSKSADEASDSVGRLAGVIDQAKFAGSQFSKVMGVVGAGINGFGKVINFYKDQVKTLVNFLTGAVNKVKSLGSAITGATSKNRGFNTSMGDAIKMVLRYGLGIRSLFVLFNRLRNALVTGFGNLAHYSSDVNFQLSSLVSSLNQLKNSLATAFAPLLSVVVPILSTVMSYAVAAANAIAQFFSVLTGKSYYISAKKVTTDYATSLDKAGSGGDKAAKGTKKANKAAKEYQRTLMGFDEINKLNDEDDKSNSGSGGSGGGAGGGAGGIDYGDMFETKEIDSKFKDMVALIKKSWEDADFTEIGSILGTKIKNALNGIPWQPIQNGAKKLGSSLATLINGVVGVDEIGRTIGKTVGEGVNTGIIFAHEFVKKITPLNIGYAIADGINGVLTTIRWQMLGDTIATGINKVFSNVNEWTRVLNFKSLGISIDTLVNTTLGGITWGDITKATQNFGEGLADTINTVFTPKTFSKIGTTLSNALNVVIEGAWKFTSKLDFNNMAKAIKGAFDNFFSNPDKWIKLGQTVNNVVHGLKKIFDSVDGKQIADAFKLIFQQIDWGAALSLLNDIWLTKKTLVASWFGNMVGQAIRDAIQFVADGISNFANWVAESLKNMLMIAVRNVFGDGAIGDWIVEKIGGSKNPQIKVDLVNSPQSEDYLKGLGFNPVPLKTQNTTSWKDFIVGANKGKKIADSIVPARSQNTTSQSSFLDGLNGGKKLRDSIVALKSRNQTTDKQYQDGANGGKKLTQSTLGMNTKNTTSADEFKKGGNGGKSLVNSTVAVNAKNATSFSNLSSGANGGHKITGQTISIAARISTSWNDLVSGFKNKVLNIGGKVVGKADGGVLVGNAWKSVHAYANGNPNINSGQMFVAREAGPELVGRIGSHTAVLNNNQIVASVSDGVARAILSVAPAISGGSNQQPIFNIVVKTERDEVLARAVQRGNAKINARYQY